MTPGRVVVVGSVNVDLVVVASRLPGPGQTVTGGDVARHHGGKGGNQAVAAARLGADVAFVGAVGDDDFGVAARAALVTEGIDVTHLLVAPRPTGVALIVVDEQAENLIAVAPGANAAPTPASVTAALLALAIGPGDVVLVSCEIPPADAGAATADAGAATTDEQPAATAGAADVEVLARRLLARDAGRAVVVTLGAAGALAVPADGQALAIPALHVVPVDTTGAGDAFNGALAAGLGAGLPLNAAVRQAVVAAGLSTMRPGARGGMPTAAELAAVSGR